MALEASDARLRTGLTTGLAAQRLVEDGRNELPRDKGRNIFRQAWDVVREPMLLLLLSAGLINFLLAEPLDGSILMLSILVVIGISLYQTHRTENALGALRDLSSPRALVVRDGERVRIPGTEVVRGDLIVIAEGDRVPADAVLLESTNLSVDESLLTGESVPVGKVADPSMHDADVARPGGDGTPWLYSGTLVVAGHGLAFARRTGASTEMGRIGAALHELTSQRTPLQREIDRLVRVVASVGVLAAAIVVVVYGLTKGSWLEGLLAGIATIMSMLPEEFPVVFTVFLALGAWKMSKRRVLARRSAVIEALGAATVIGVDKTGTLTMNRMSVMALIVDGHTHSMGVDSHEPRVLEVMRTGRLASPIRPFDPMDTAFVSLAERFTIDEVDDSKLLREYALSSDLLAVTQVWASDGGVVVASKGAPEAIADLCRMDESQRKTMMNHVQEAADNGQRVLGVAHAVWPDSTVFPDDPRTFAFEFLGLACLQDPVRPNARDAIAMCSQAGVRIVMITGDYPGTALAIAREVGIESSAGCLTGAQLSEMSLTELDERVQSVNVFARMVPEQKLQLIRAFKDNGEVVGMTGDGVNDAPALRAADIGIAMGLRGTDVARESADLVITDDDFASIAEGVRQGRGIFDNLRKAMAYIVAVHVSIFGMALLPLFVSDWPLVLLPIQLALLELVIDPACSIVFEAEQHDPRLMERPPRAVDRPIFGRQALTIAVMQGVGLFVGVAAVYLWSVNSGNTSDQSRSLTFTALVFGNLALIVVNRSWRLSAIRTFVERRNPMVKWILGATTSLLFVLLLVPAVRDAFSFGPVGAVEIAICAGVAVVGASWFEVLKAFGRRGMVSITTV
jgi:Ca2+-transporting ATPase